MTILEFAVAGWAGLMAAATAYNWLLVKIGEVR